MSYAIATIFSPLIVKPFLNPSEDDQNSTEATTYNYESPTDVLSTSTPHMFENRLSLPFGIVGCISILCGLLGLYVFYRYRIDTSYNSSNGFVINEDTEENSNHLVDKVQFKKKDEAFIVAVSALAICFYLGIESNSFSFLSTFVTESLPSSIDKTVRTQKGADMSSALGFDFAFGRVLALLMATRFRSHNLLLFNVTFLIVSNVILLCCDKTETILWVASITLGLGMSSFLATVYTYCEERIRMVS